jgi:hypothetical protein
MKVTSKTLAGILKIPESEYCAAKLYEAGFEYRYQIHDLNPQYHLALLTARLVASEYNKSYTFHLAQASGVTTIMLTHKVHYGLLTYPQFTEDQIREAAYYLAEKNNFIGDPNEYWLEAKRQLSSNKHI